jgi:myo-inositol-1(or 4)-monophosphatase
MTAADTVRRLAEAQDIAAEAGALALGYFRRLDTLQVRGKGPRDMVSEADEAVETLIRRRLAQAFPEDGFLGEESGHAPPQPGHGTWVVDPIDGTQPFVSGLPNWCISIGYAQGTVAELGVVLDPCGEEMFAARRGAAATLNGRPIAPHRGTTLTDGIVSVGHSPRVAPARVLTVLSGLLHHGGMFHRNGSGALCLCYVACGRLLGYVECHINSWDCCAALAINQAAGARTNDFLAGDGLLSGNPIVAGPSAVFQQLAELLPKD